MQSQLFKDLTEMELTSQERQAFVKLQSDGSFQAFANVMERWLLKKAVDLMTAPHENQEFTLAKVQGAHEFYDRMMKLVDESKNPKQDLKA